MKRMTTKMSTVTPKSTMTKSKSVGQGVKNIAKAKYGPVAMSMSKKAYKEGAAEMMNPSFESLSKADKNRIAGSVAAGAMASTIMPKPKKRIPTRKTTTSPKTNAKMLPEVKVTAPGKFKRFVSKTTSKRK